MALLNKLGYPVVEIKNDEACVSLGMGRFYTTIKNWCDGNDYWYCCIRNELALYEVPIEKIIKPEILQKIIHDSTTFLVFCNEWESFTDLIEPIYIIFVNNLKIPPKKIIVLSDNADMNIIIKDIAAASNQDTINFEWVICLEYVIKNDVINNLDYISKIATLEKKSYNKAFLNFNRRWRTHRPLMIGLLHSMNLLNKGFVSLEQAGNDKWDEYIFNIMLDLVKMDPELYNLLYSNKTEILNLPNLYLDTVNIHTRNPNKLLAPDGLTDIDNKRLYEDSYFSLVSETYCIHSYGRFLSEKTFKPIAQSHPFIIISDSKILALLKTLGYKTFHPFIDESYDDEPNPILRIKMILKEVKRLSELSEPELFEFIDNVKEITKFNFNTLKEKKNHTYKIL